MGRHQHEELFTTSTVYDSNTQFMAAAVRIRVSRGSASARTTCGAYCLWRDYAVYGVDRYASHMPDPTQKPENPPELPHGLALAWGVAPYPQRGPKREISVERIVAEAVRIADEEGIDAVSMAAVAKEVGFTSMSLYRYVSSKDDLLLLMLEAATPLPPEWEREDEPSSAAPSWRSRLEQLYRGQVQIYIRHPWTAELVRRILGLPTQGAPVTPRSSAWLEAGLAALAGTPLTAEERTAAILAVVGQARFHGTVAAGYSEGARSAGLQEEEMNNRQNALYDAVIAEGEYPHLRDAIDVGVFLGDADPFQFGLARLLDGIEAYIEALERGEPHEDIHPTDSVQ